MEIETQVIRAYGREREINYSAFAPEAVRKAFAERAVQRLLVEILNESIPASIGPRSAGLIPSEVFACLRGSEKASQYNTVMMHCDTERDLFKSDLIDIRPNPDGSCVKYFVGLEVVVNDDAGFEEQPEGRVYRTFLYDRWKPAGATCIQHYL